MDIKLKITRGKNQELYLTAKTMNELVDKIIEWQDYDDYVKTIKQFKNYTVFRLQILYSIKRTWNVHCCSK